MLSILHVSTTPPYKTPIAGAFSSASQCPIEQVEACLPYHVTRGWDVWVAHIVAHFVGVETFQFPCLDGRIRPIEVSEYSGFVQLASIRSNPNH